MLHCQRVMILQDYVEKIRDPMRTLNWLLVLILSSIAIMVYALILLATADIAAQVGVPQPGGSS